jgi:hypothetical protein
MSHATSVEKHFFLKFVEAERWGCFSSPLQGLLPAISLALDVRVRLSVLADFVSEID